MLNNALAPQWLSRPRSVMSRQAPALADFRRIVIKVGSSLLVDSGGGRLKDDWLVSLAEDIAALHGDKRDLLVVSSGAIALGRAVLRLPADRSSSRTARRRPPSARSRWRAPGRRCSAATASPPARCW